MSNELQKDRKVAKKFSDLDDLTKKYASAFALAVNSEITICNSRVSGKWRDDSDIDIEFKNYYSPFHANFIHFLNYFLEVRLHIWKDNYSKYKVKLSLEEANNYYKKLKNK